MVSGSLALIFLILAVLAIIGGTSKIKLNPFFVLLTVTILFGVAVRMPPNVIIENIKSGFGGTLGSIGIVILIGTMIGTILEKTGATISMSRAILKLVGKERSTLSLSISGFVTSIPVFCDSGYVILSPLNRALAKESGESLAVTSIALATGLYATHTLVPPTPGPIAAAGELGADLGKVILLGIVAAIPAMLAGYFWATRYCKRFHIDPSIGHDHQTQNYEDLPSPLHSFLPLVLPILLIFLKTLAEYPTTPLGEGGIKSFCSFVGDPIIALLLGLVTAFSLVPKKEKREAYSQWLDEGIKNAALIIAVTGVGGAFGAILRSSPVTDFIKEALGGLPFGIALPFLLSMAIKSAQGSSTVAIITTAAIVSPLLSVLNIDPALTVLAIGAGAMVVSHSNDSYFWVVSKFSDMDIETAYKGYTTATLIEGVAAFAIISLFSLFM